MKILKNIKRIFVIVVFIILASSGIALHDYTLATSSGLSVSGPSLILKGQDAVFTVQYDSNVNSVLLSTGDIILNGFTATVSISGTGNTRKITLRNIQGIGDNKTITIAAGTAVFNDGSEASSEKSNLFKIKEKPVQPVIPPENNTTNNNNNTNNNTQNNNQQQNNNNEQNQEKPEENNEKPQEENNEQNNKPQENEEPDWIPNPNTGK